MLRLFTRRMAAKVFFAIGIAVGAALLIQAWADARRTAQSLKAGTQASASQLASLMVGSVEHSMLDGDGIKVKALIGDLKGRVEGADIRIYDQRGIEVFAPKAKPSSSLPKYLEEALRDGATTRSPAGAIVRPVPNEERCRSCHEEQDENAKYKQVRGALELTVDPKACASMRDEVLSGLLREGFTHMMTAKQSAKLDSYFEEVAGRAAGVRAVAVYEDDATAKFGDDIDGLDEEVVMSLFRGAGEHRVIERADGSVRLIPLAIEERCTSCHQHEELAIGKIHGVLAVLLDKAPSECAEAELLDVVDTSLRYIMLSALGRRIADFLDAVAATSAVREVSLYDNDGRRYWTTTHPAPPSHVAKVLDSGKGMVQFLGSGKAETVRVVEPLHNAEGCQRCHGSDSKLRGVVSVALSTGAAATARTERMNESYWFTGYTLAGILVIILGLVQFLVVRPVNHIGDVAEQVGKGNLSVRVERADPDGDEIRRLGTRINEMVKGLRAKTQLEKFVSRGASEAARDADEKGVSRTGIKRAITILFSDIRGFTSFSEIREPEEVVEMLNRLLQAQADVVHAHGGDIDKFVGDELMAIFHGDDAQERAICCGVKMIEAVELARRTDLDIGVGINCGNVVYGAIGHEDRMDFTVIGDVVNTGARLCAAASGGEVLLSASVADAVGAIDGIELEKAEPLSLKGKRNPLAVFRARKRDSDA